MPPEKYRMSDLLSEAMSKPATMGDIHLLTQLQESNEAEIGRLRGKSMTQQEIRDGVREGLVDAIKELTSDKEWMDKFGGSLYESLSKRAESRATEWVGRKVMWAIVTAIFIASLTWSVKTGQIK